ncbi:hypothetical protein ACI65C_005007 [Semiaphis heraclei]
MSHQNYQYKCFFYDSVNIDENDHPGVVDESSESTLPILNVVFVKSDEPMLSGRRLVDIEHFMKQIMELGKHGSKCTMGRYALINEVQNGVAFKLYFKCNVCNRHQVVTSEKEQCLDSVNNVFVWGALSIGIGHRQAEDLLAVMNCPSPSFKKFKRHEVLIGKGVIIGAETKKPVYVGVRNKYCSTCSSASKNDKKIDHLCFRNYDGSSTGMEQDIIVEGFRQSLEQHGLMYKYYIGDGDSSVYARIVEKVSYGRDVIKLECANHITPQVHSRGPSWHLSPWKKLTGKSPGKLFKRNVSKRIAMSKYKKRNTFRCRVNRDKSTVNHDFDYGPDAAGLDMTEEDFNLNASQKLYESNHVFNVEELRLVEGLSFITGFVVRQTSVTLEPYKVKLELDGSRNITHASCQCPAGVGSKCKHVAALIIFINNEEGVSKTNEPQIWGKGASNMLYGLETENKAYNTFSSLYNVEVIKSGLIIHISKPWICASPDGLILNNGEITSVLEIKCPSSCKNKPIIDSATGMPNLSYLKLQNNEIVLKSSHVYYTQIQILLYCTGLNNYIEVPSMTFDGPATNFTMANTLGADLTSKQLKTNFPHPSDSSKDHLELFFNAVRARGGWCVNPTAKHFSDAYKKLVMHHSIKSSGGNVEVLDQTSILHATRTPVTKYFDTTPNNDTLSISNSRRFDENEEYNNEDLDDILSLLPNFDIDREKELQKDLLDIGLEMPPNYFVL